MLKIAAISIVVVLLAQLFRGWHSEFGMYVGLAGCLFVFFYIIGKITGLFSLVEQLKDYVPIGSVYLEILLKMVGITYLTEFCSDLCKDAGFGAIAGQVSLAGRLTLLALSIPVLCSLVESIAGLWGGI